MKTFNYGFEIKTKNGNFYPVHLNSDQLSFTLDCFIHGIQTTEVVNAYARKSQIKGVEFKIICARKSNVLNTENISREYSILIHPNWNVQILDHWRSGNTVPRFEELSTGAERLNQVLVEEFLSKVNDSFIATENQIFANDEWVVIRKIKDTIMI